MTIPRADPTYSQGNENQARQEIDRELKKRARKGDTLYFDRNEVVISAPDGSRWAVKVDNTGALTTEARA